MMAWTSPGCTVRSMPRRMTLSSTRAWRFLISSMVRDDSRDVPVSANTSFQTHPQQLLRLDGELHRQFAEHLLAEAVHDHVDRVLAREAALPAVEDLVLADLRGGCLVFD